MTKQFCPLDEEGDLLAEKVHQFTLKKRYRYARPDHVYALAFSLVRNYEIAQKPGIHYVVECIQGSDPRRSGEALKALFFAMRIAIKGQTGLPRDQEQRLIDAASVAFDRDSKGSFIEKTQKQDAGVHEIAQNMGAYVVARPLQVDEKALSLFATILDASLGRMKTYGIEDLFGNNFPFDKLGRHITDSFDHPNVARIYLERTYSILTAANFLETECIASLGQLYRHHYECQTIEEARSALRALEKLYPESAPTPGRPTARGHAGILLTKKR